MMQRHLLLRSGGYAAAVRALNPLLWLRLDEAAGTTAANHGSLGAAASGLIGGATTLGQPGPLGPNQAVDLDGATSYIEIPNHPALASAALHTIAVLARAESAGEISFGYFASWAPGVIFRFRLEGSLSSLRAQDDFSGVDANTITTTGLAAGQWTWVFKTLSADRVIRLYRGLSGALAEYAYSTQTAGTGSYLAPSGALMFGSRDTFDVTFDGQFDEILYFDRPLSTGALARLVRLSGV